jgi:DNA-binding transcriptional MerR regulator
MLPFEQEGENLTHRFPIEKSILRINKIQDLRQGGLSIPEIKNILHKFQK